MRPLSATQLFELWERGLVQPPAVRAQALLAACAPEAAPDELGALSVGRRDAQLLRLRAALFGPELHSRAPCAACGEALEWSVDTAALLPAETGAAPGGATLTADGLTVHFRCPTAGDLAELALHPASPAALRDELVARCVLSVQRDGAEAGVGALSESTRARLAAAMAAADPAAELRLAVSCPGCGAASEALLDVVSFFWAEIEAWVRRTARDVHALASAYGWREADVLAMGPARRRLYLDQLGS